jgi:uncharacterized protein
MQALHDKTVRVNSGHAWEMKKGQRVRITFQSIVDFVVFNRDNLQERFDQARTKANQGKIYLSTGDQLLSKLNNPMMTIVEDTFKGTHDLQYGMCSECSYTTRWNRRHLPPWNKLYPEAGITCREDLPLWGCYENIMTALQNYPIVPLDIPAPLNIGQHMELDEKGNLIWAVFAKHKDSSTPSRTSICARRSIVCVPQAATPAPASWAAPRDSIRNRSASRCSRTDDASRNTRASVKQPRAAHTPWTAADPTEDGARLWQRATTPGVSPTRWRSRKRYRPLRALTSCT